MSKIELLAKIELLNKYEAMIEEMRAEAETVRDSIKAEMLARDTEELTAGQYIIRWTSVLSNRFDTTGFKKAYGDLYKSYTKQIASRRFTISARYGETVGNNAHGIPKEQEFVKDILNEHQNPCGSNTFPKPARGYELPATI